jgi:hypothetical protein
MDDLPEGTFMVDYVNLADGCIHTARWTKKTLIAKLGNRAVYKEVIPPDSPDELDLPLAEPQDRVGKGADRNDSKEWASRGRPFLNDFMKRWAGKHVAEEERAKWEFLTEVLKKGVRIAPVNTLMPLFRQGDNVYLCVRPAGDATSRTMYPIYRYMHGDLVTFAEFYDVKVRHVVDAARAVLDSCASLQVFGGIHHCDIKAENILFRVRGLRTKSTPPGHGTAMMRAMHGSLANEVANGSKHVEFVLSDFGSAVSRPTVRDLIHMQGTSGYMSPLVYRQKADFAEDIEYARSRIADPGGSPSDFADRIWDSYAKAIALRDTDTLDVDMAMVKNDLFALGVIILLFEYPDGAKDLRDLGWALLMGDDPRTWKLSSVQDDLEAVVRRLNDAGAMDEDVVMVSMLRRQRFDGLLGPTQRRETSRRSLPGSRPGAPGAILKKVFSSAATGTMRKGRTRKVTK